MVARKNYDGDKSQAVISINKLYAQSIMDEQTIGGIYG